MPRLPPALLRPDASDGESTAGIANASTARRLNPARRQAHAQMSQAETMACCRLAPSDQALLERAIESLQLSARAMHRILRVARTIADLADSGDIATGHLTEALAYRRG